MCLGWAPVLIVSAAQFGGYADRALTAAFASDLQAQFALTDAQLGMLHGTAVIIPYAVGMVAASLWLKAERPFLLMALSVIGWTLAAAAFALATSQAGLFAARMMLGFTQAAFMPAALSILSVASHPPPSVAISALTTGSATGRSGGLLLGGALLLMATQLNVADLEPWRLASLAMVAPNLLLALALLAKSDVRAPYAASPAAGLGPTLRGMSRARLFHASYFLTAAAAIIVVQAEGAWAPTLLHRDYGLSVADSAMAVGLIVLFAAPLGHLGAGRVVAALRHRTAWPHGLILLGLAVALASALILLRASHLVVAMLALAGFSAGGGFAAAAALIGLQPVIPAEQRFVANTLFIGAVTLAGYGIGPWLTGILSDSLGHHELAVSLALVTAAAFAAAALASIVGRRSPLPAAGASPLAPGG
ncbi:MFS transporter [Allosphingosinicella sp.]|uniref:MFS transporter n=1 Tax=Allosphingosinicella sp. TaxID=2823234 RepID=UPI003D759294